MDRFLRPAQTWGSFQFCVPGRDLFIETQQQLSSAQLALFAEEMAAQQTGREFTC